MATGATVDPRERHAGWVAPLCWMAVALEGFDLVVLGVVLPALLDEPGWGLTPNTASLVSVIGLVGVMVGALTVGTISDYIGRRQTMLWTVISFSILTLLCAFAPNPWIFGLLRFLAGLGLGGVLPTALALVRPRGTIVQKTTVAGAQTMAWAPIVIDEISVIGSRCGPFDRALAALASGEVDVSGLVSTRFDLSRGVAALEHAKSKGVLKVLLDVST